MEYGRFVRTQKHIFIERIAAAVLLSLVLVLGAWLSHKTGLAELERQKKQLLVSTQIMTRALNYEEVTGLQLRQEIINTPEYQSLRGKLTKYIEVIPKARWAYTLHWNGSQFVIGVDTTPELSAEYSPAGKIYHEAPPALKEALNGQGLVLGPYTDRWGSFYTAAVPLRPSASVSPHVLVCIDVDVGVFEQGARTAEHYGYALTLLALALIVTGYIARERRSRVLQSLFESEQKFKAIFENEIFAICQLDAETGRFIEVNEAFVSVYGYSREELLASKTIYDVSEEPEATVFAFKKLCEFGKGYIPFRYHRKKNGTIFPVEIIGNTSYSKGRKVLVISIRDISDRIKNEQSLRESQVKLNTIVQNAHEAIFIVQDGILKFANPNTLEIIGYDEEELRHIPFINFIHPDDRMIVANNHRRRLSGEIVDVHYEFRFLHKSRGTRWAEIRSFLVDWDGRPGTLNFINDITERRQIEESLRESEERFRAIASAASDAILLVDERGLIEYASFAAQRIFGVTTDSLVRTDIRKLVFAPKDEERLMQALQTSLGSAEPQRLELAGRSSQNEHIDLEVALSGVKMRERLYAVALVRDISQRKLLELNADKAHKQLIHSEKLASIGTLAAGVAHEINNPLTIIKGNNYVMQDMLKSGSFDGQAFLKFIEKQDKATDRIVKIVSGLRTYARADTEHMGPINLNQIVHDTLSLVHDIYVKNGIKVVTKMSSRDLIVKGNTGKIQQVLVNLLTNARDATEGRPGREIGIETRVNPSGNAENELIVWDNGCGISPENLPKLYDPFFTTKPPGKGTGLGLSISMALISAMGGKMSVESELNKGTRFTIRFAPESHEAHAPQRVEPAAPAPEIKRYQGTVLIVDDEAEIRALLKTLLLKRGLLVEEAENGHSALEILKTREFDYVFTDLKMPSMSGDELLRQCEPLRRDKLQATRFIVITGGIITDYTQEQRQAIRELADGYVVKPFSDEDLERALGSELSSL